MNMLGISEMRWAGSGQLLEGGKTILYSGHLHTHPHGVGIILSKEAQRALIGWQPVNHHNQIQQQTCKGDNHPSICAH